MTRIQTTIDQASMTKRNSFRIGFSSLVIGQFLAVTIATIPVTGAELVRLNGETVDAKLVAVDANRLQFMAMTPIVLPVDELIRWGNPQVPRSQILVMLADGGRLVTAAAWSGGAPLRIENDKIVVLTDTWGELPLARRMVRGLVLAQRSHSEDREELERVVREEAYSGLTPTMGGITSSDVLLLTNKDRVTGKLAALAGGSLTFETAGGTVKIPLSRVEAVVFAREDSDGSSSAQPNPLRLVIGTRDGSIVFANAMSSKEDGLKFELADGPVLSVTSLEDIALLQSFGGRFDYLSDLEPDGYRHVPYLSIEWPYMRDRNVLGEPLSVGGKRYLKGIGMHSAARLTYQLDRKYLRFDAAVAIDDSSGHRGSVTFGVYVLRDGAWTEAFTSEMVRGGEAPRPISVDLKGAQGLTLTVDYADRGDELDRANWLDARLVKVD